VLLALLEKIPPLGSVDIDRLVQRAEAAELFEARKPRRAEPAFAGPCWAGGRAGGPADAPPQVLTHLYKKNNEFGRVLDSYLKLAVRGRAALRSAPNGT
jgi:hypothetical protein